MSALFAFLHHISFLAIMIALFAEILLLKLPLTLETARRIRAYDAMYGMAALAVLGIGALRVMYFEKGAAYYMHSAPFMGKMAFFLAAGLLSIYPTITFLKWGKPLKSGSLPDLGNAQRHKLRLVLHLEAGLMLLVILCAAMMAKGVGYMGQ